MALALQDTQLLAQIDGGDLNAKEAKCLVSLRNRYRSYKRKSSQAPENIDEQMSESRVFVELVSFINKVVESGTLLFKLVELYSLYVDRLGDFGIKKLVNKTRLKVRLLQHFPEAQEQCDGKNVIIFKRGMEKMLNEALKKRDFSEDAAILVKVAMIIRSDAFDHHCSKLSGTFPSKCQEDSLPSSLKSLIFFNI